MPLVNFQTHGFCQLNCKFCLYGDKKVTKLREGWTLENFKPVADKLLDMGIDRFDMTPSLGEVFINNDIWDMLDYIDGRASYIQIYTHGLNLNPSDFRRMRSMKSPFTLFFSVYGDSRESYQDITGHDRFDDFLETLSNLKTYMLPLHKQNHIRVGFDIRFKEIELPLHVSNIPLGNKLWRELLLLQGYDNIIIGNKWENSNWGVAFPDLPYPKEQKQLIGACDCCAVTLNPNGDAVICDICHPLDDRFEKLGNVFTDDPKMIYTNLNNIMAEMHEGIFPDVCLNCTEYTCEGDIEDYFSYMDKKWKTRKKVIWDEDSDC